MFDIMVNTYFQILRFFFQTKEFYTYDKNLSTCKDSPNRMDLKILR